MSTIALRNKAMGTHTPAGKAHTSIWEKWKAYYEESGLEIACAMLSMNGRSDGFRTYLMLRDQGRV